MASDALERLMNDARVHLPGALDSAIKQTFFNVLDEFFQTSSAWREDVDFDTVVGETEYEIDTDDSFSRIVRLMGVVNADDIQVVAFMPTPPTVELDNEPTVVETLTAKVILTLSDPVDDENFPQFPSWMMDKYRRGFLDGLLGTMMSQPAKPYSSERLAIYHLRRFRDVIAQARVDANHTHLHAAQAWKFPGGWR